MLFTPFQLFKEKKKERYKSVYYKCRRNSLLIQPLRNPNANNRPVAISALSKHSISTEKKRSRDEAGLMVRKMALNLFQIQTVSPKKCQLEMATWRNFQPFQEAIKEHQANPQRIRLGISGQRHKFTKKHTRSDSTGSKKQMKLQIIDLNEVASEEIKQIRGVTFCENIQKGSKTERSKDILQRSNDYLQEEFAARRYRRMSNRLSNKSQKPDKTKDQMENMLIEGWEVSEHDLGNYDLI